MAGSGLFAPPTEHWVPLSPRYLPLRRLSAALSWGVLAALFVTPVFLFVDLLVGPRAREEEERQGLDTTAHGETAYRF